MNENNPPRWAVRFLEWFTPNELTEGILGDLYEEYDTDIAKEHPYPNRRFIWNVLRFFRPGILLRNKFIVHQTGYHMFLNNIKISLRSLMKNKLYSSINATGLSIAISFTVLIFFYIQDEKSFDQWHSKKDRIYRINSIQYTDNWAFYEGSEKTVKFPYLQTSLGPVLNEESPVVEKFTRFNPDRDAVLLKNDQAYNVQISFVDNNFFNMFDFDIFYGDKSQLLSEVKNAVISQSASEKYFGDSNPMGEQLHLTINGEDKSFIVTGVIENPPSNTSLVYNDILLRIENKPYYEENLDSWTNWNTPVFVQLGIDNTREQLIQSLRQVHEKYVLPAENEASEEGEENVEKADDRPLYEATLIADIHLDNSVNWTRVSDPKYSYILSGIGLLILIIACINYITLAMTSSEAKKQEVGIRKVAGSSRKSLIIRFITESVMLAMFAMFIAIILIYFFLPYFNQFTNKSIDISENWYAMVLALLSFSILIGIVAGLYPSFFITSVKPSSILKTSSSSKFSTKFTRPLVVLQFVISSFLMICSVIMLMQMNYIASKDLGYNKEQVLVIPTNTGWTDKGENVVNRFRKEVDSNPDVLAVSGTSSSFNRGWSRNTYEIDDKVHLAYTYRIDPRYVDVLGIKIKEGRNFDEEIISDNKKSLIVNEALVKDMGWENPLHETLDWRHEDSLGGWKIIGVAENFHFMSLENKIEPLFMYMDSEVGKITTMLIKISPKNIPNTIDYLAESWKKLMPDKPFDYNFLDEDVEEQYQQYAKWSNIMTLTTAFAILIGCLGLFGLAGINTINRTKEIGIRKAMGAGFRDIALLMNKPIVAMSIIAYVIAIPLSWYAMQKWLSDFEFSISINWSIYGVTFLAAVFLAFITVTYHTIKAARLNPGETLKYE